MSKKKNKKDESIFVRSLAPSGELIDVESQVYSKFLEEIFNNDSIQNIAFTGGYGVGKSSILRSYKKPNHFLYLSLGDFSGEKSKRNEQSVEAELLREIVARCSRKKVPSSNIELIPEKKTRIIPAVLVGVLIILAYFLLFQTKQTVIPHLSDIIVYTFSATSPIFKEKTIYLGSVFYYLFGIFLTISGGFLIFYIIPHIKWNRISLFEGNLEIESEGSQGYLDRFGFELIYAIESIAKQYDYTIVFEDLDRLNSDVYSSLCLKLRDINKIINDRKIIKTLRFIYTINDEMLAQISEGTKFFDYILPLYPAFATASIKERWKVQYLPEIGLEYSGYIKTIIDEAAAENVYEFADYRIVQDIQNEYKVLEAIDGVRNKTNASYSSEWRFLFVVYKVLFPIDYHKIRLNQSVIFIDNKAEIEDKIARYEKGTLQNTNRYSILRVLLSLTDEQTSKAILRTIIEQYFGRSKRWLFYQYHIAYEKLPDLSMLYDQKLYEEIWKCLRYFAYGLLYGDSETQKKFKELLIANQELFAYFEKTTKEKYLTGDEFESIKKELYQD